jgi:hypothetical protein
MTEVVLNLDEGATTTADDDEDDDDGVDNVAEDDVSTGRVKRYGR